MKWILPVLGLACLVNSCGPAEPPVRWVGGPVVEVASELLVAEPVDFAAALQDLDVLVARGWSLSRLGLLDGVEHSLIGDVGEVLSVAELPDGQVLISGSEGLGLLEGNEIRESPLSDELAANGDLYLTSTPGHGVWLASESRLSLWRDGELFSVSVDGYSTAEAQVAWGPDPELEEETGAWVASGPDVYFLRPWGTGFRVVPVLGELEGAGVRVDAYGGVWIPSGGDIHHRTPEGDWELLRFPAPVTSLGCKPGSASVWVSAGDSLWTHRGNSWTRLEHGGEILGLDWGGRVLVGSDAGLHRVAAGRPLLLLGLEDGAQLEVGMDLRLLPAAIALAPRSYTAELDGLETPVEVDDEGVATVWLDPIELADGAHSLDVAAHYRAGEVAPASLFFAVGDFVAPTWSADIRPIYELRCTPCHASEGGAHLLDGPAAWQAEIEIVIDNIETEKMPLNNNTNPNYQPLPAEERQLVRAWAAGGFLE